MKPLPQCFIVARIQVCAKRWSVLYSQAISWPRPHVRFPTYSNWRHVWVHQATREGLENVSVFKPFRNNFCKECKEWERGKERKKECFFIGYNPLACTIKWGKHWKMHLPHHNYLLRWLASCFATPGLIYVIYCWAIQRSSKTRKRVYTSKSVSTLQWFNGQTGDQNLYQTGTIFTCIKADFWQFPLLIHNRIGENVLAV